MFVSCCAFSIKIKDEEAGMSGNGSGNGGARKQVADPREDDAIADIRRRASRINGERGDESLTASLAGQLMKLIAEQTKLIDLLERRISTLERHTGLWPMRVEETVG
jgi:hypothetical protein